MGGYRQLDVTKIFPNSQIGVHNASCEIRIHVEDYSEKWRAGGMLLRSGGTAPPLLDETAWLVGIWGVGKSHGDILLGVGIYNWFTLMALDVIEGMYLQLSATEIWAYLAKYI